MPTATTRTPQTVTHTTPTRTTRTPPTLVARSSARSRRSRSSASFAEHWERQALVVPRHESGRFDDLLSVRDVERLVTETALRTPVFRLVQAGEQLGRYTTELSWRPEPFTGVADVRRVLAAFEAGATIVLNLLSVGAAYGLIVAVFQYGWRNVPPRLPAGRHHRGLGAAVPVRGAVRPLDGLAGLPALAHPRALLGDGRQRGQRQFAAQATSPSRVNPAGGSRRSPPAPANPRNAEGGRPCSRRESPPIPAQPASAMTGLSRRRSRVRVPSLPSLKAPVNTHVLLS
jgi:hypothetical protein